MVNVIVAQLRGTAGQQGFTAGARAPSGPTLALPLQSKSKSAWNKQVQVQVQVQ